MSLLRSYFCPKFRIFTVLKDYSRACNLLLRGTCSEINLTQSSVEGNIALVGWIAMHTLDDNIDSGLSVMLDFTACEIVMYILLYVALWFFAQTAASTFGATAKKDGRESLESSFQWNVKYYVPDMPQVKCDRKCNACESKLY